MNLFKKYFLILLVIPILAFSAHKYYISFTKIEYSEKSKSLQIIMRVFTDDLQNGLDKQFSIKTELDTDKELSNANEFISKYLKDKFLIRVNNELKTYTYLGRKYDTDATKIYIEIENIKNIESIEIQNKVLMELFDDQQNIIKLNINNKKKSFILTIRNDKDMLNF